MTFRPITIKDYSQLIEFWEENYLTTPLDEYEHMKMFLDKNPNLSLLAEEDGKIVGTVLAAYDGRRGGLQKLVVKRDKRGKGIGQKLVKEAVKRMLDKGALDIRFNTDEELVTFYEKCGFIKDSRPTMILRKF